MVQKETKPGNASPVKSLTEDLEKFQTMDRLPRNLPWNCTSEQYQSVMFSPGPIKTGSFLGGVDPELLEKAQNPQGPLQQVLQGAIECT
jgi:hypothetical protein